MVPPACFRRFYSTHDKRDRRVCEATSAEFDSDIV